jgi:hypothetical protein
VCQASNDARPHEEIEFYSRGGRRNEVVAVLDTRSSLSIVSKHLIPANNPYSLSPTKTLIEDSLGTRYTQIGTVVLTWFRPGRPTTFEVEFAVVEDDLDVMILGKEACQDSQVRKELELRPFGLAPGEGKTRREKETEARRRKDKDKEIRKEREDQVRAQTASDQQKRNKEEQASHGGPTQASHVPRQGHGQQQHGFGSEQAAYVQ